MLNILHGTKKIGIISFISFYNIDLIFQSKRFDLISSGFLWEKKKQATTKKQSSLKQKNFLSRHRHYSMLMCVLCQAVEFLCVTVYTSV